MIGQLVQIAIGASLGVASMAACRIGIDAARGHRAAVADSFKQLCQSVIDAGPGASSDAAYARIKESAASGWLLEDEARAAKDCFQARGDDAAAVAAHPQGPGFGKGLDKWMPWACFIFGWAFYLGCTYRAAVSVAFVTPIVAAALACVTASDLEWRTIPNMACLACGAAGLASILLLGQDAVAAAILAAAFVVLLACARKVTRGAVGLGDVKLGAAAMLCCGYEGALVGVFALLLACAGYLAWGKATGKAGMKSNMPFGPALAIMAACGLAWRCLSPAIPAVV